MHLIHCRGQYWHFTIDGKEKCVKPEGVPTSNISGCRIFFKPCGQLPDNVCSGDPATNSNSSVCQQVDLKNGTKYHYNLGYYSTEHIYHPTCKYDCSHEVMVHVHVHCHTVRHYESLLRYPLCICKCICTALYCEYS